MNKINKYIFQIKPYYRNNEFVFEFGLVLRFLFISGSMNFCKKRETYYVGMKPYTTIINTLYIFKKRIYIYFKIWWDKNED